MAYRVDTFDTLFSSTEGDDDAASDAVRLEKALNAVEQQGWKLVGQVPQSRSWDDDGEFTGWKDHLLILHKSS